MPRKQREPEETEAEKTTTKRLLYAVEDIAGKLDSITERQDQQDDLIRTSLGATPQSGQIAPPRTFVTSEERAHYESLALEKARATVSAVSTGRLIGAQQEESLALLEEKSGVKKRANEVVFALASYLEKHELLKRALGGTPFGAQLLKIAPYLVIVAGFAFGAYVFGNPQNFAQVVQGLQDWRTILVLVVIVSVVFSFTLWSYLRRRRQSLE